MSLTDVRIFMRTPIARLAVTYVAIIMTMSLGFSFVFYRTSSNELGRQIPQRGMFVIERQVGFGMPAQQLDDFLQERIDEGRRALLVRLVGLNVLAFTAGSALSYWLARRTLAPIEDAMNAQAQFVSDASHELRTPLTAIIASNDVALRDKKLSLAQAKAVIRQNAEDAQKLHALSDGLLKLARGDAYAVTLSRVPLQDIAADAMNQVLHPALAKNITVHDKVPKIFVHANKTAATQALVILLDNAIKYSAENGNVYLGASTRGKYVYLTVRDEGVGIRASDLPHIFRRFYRADAARTKHGQNGYGLGLAIAQKLVTQQNGEITAESTLGKGSTFTIKLPFAP